jgi:hypothetical protein
VKNFVVCVIILLLGVLGPQQSLEFEPVWSLGLLLLLAFLVQQLTTYLRLPALIGWIGAGLILGPSCLQVVQPGQFVSLQLVHIFAALWVGFLVGTEFSWPRESTRWRVSGFLGLTTLAIFLLTAVAIGSITKLPGWLAFLFAALATLWGPFVTWQERDKGHVLTAGILGNGFSLVVLSATLIFLYLQGFLPVQALHLTGRIWLSLLAGALGVEILWRLKIFAAPIHTLLPALLASFVLATSLLYHLQLYALPCGLAAGLTLAWHRGCTAPLQRMQQFMRPMAFATFFALVGATIDLRTLWPPPYSLYQILVVEILVLLFLRGLLPTIWSPFSTAATGPDKHIGWLLLPRGALLFELIYHQNSLVGLLSGPSAHLLHQVALADILIHLLVFSLLAAFIWRLVQPVASQKDAGQKELETHPAPAT